MMYSLALKPYIAFVFQANICVAWGPLLESGSGRRFAIKSVMAGSENNHPEHEDSLTIETSIRVQDIIDNSRNQVSGLLDAVSQRADLLATETFADFGKEQCTDDECDWECLIPEEWASISGEVDIAEVMNFLGLQRAQPLRGPVDWE